MGNHFTNNRVRRISGNTLSWQTCFFNFRPQKLASILQNLGRETPTFF